MVGMEIESPNPSKSMQDSMNSKPELKLRSGLPPAYAAGEATVATTIANIHVFTIIPLLVRRGQSNMRRVQEVTKLGDLLIVSLTSSLATPWVKIGEDARAAGSDARG